MLAFYEKQCVRSKEEGGKTYTHTYGEGEGGILLHMKEKGRRYMSACAPQNDKEKWNLGGDVDLYSCVCGSNTCKRRGEGNRFYSPSSADPLKGRFLLFRLRTSVEIAKEEGHEWPGKEEEGEGGKKEEREEAHNSPLLASMNKQTGRRGILPCEKKDCCLPLLLTSSWSELLLPSQVFGALLQLSRK